MYALGTIIYTALLVFFLLLWVRFIVDWIQVFARQWVPQGVLLVAIEGAYTATDPPIKALRRVVPPLRLGNVMLDLSFMIVMLSVYLLMQVVRQTML